MSMEHDAEASTLYVHVDRAKALSCGKPAIGWMLCKIHVWRCTADIAACRLFYEALCAVDDEYEVWRRVVVSKPEPRLKFAPPNIFLRFSEKMAPLS